ncbi:UDP-N-acetylglucosamine 2-epimerase [Candidatus Magnetaquicoccaceae bacterium FCR-1]|uniref:UDP-N-acetylglucosamine 2-epimerase (non-hydrolyzing) n=1 Tax=Candidatus Magnetaquiglobus chichijimensis TaxID=3141448 RepID=A0ABQ0CBS0_9PROT
MKRHRWLVLFGTRPEAIKLAPLILAAQQLPTVDIRICHTGQHRDMTSHVLKLFNIRPDIDLEVMQPDQSLSDLTTLLLSRLHSYLQQDKPDWVIVQGDTTTTFIGALAAFYQRIPVAHVEAGLRTGHIYAPWPEEMNRRLIGRLATLHFPPTDGAQDNLLKEGIPEEQILVTGNTGIDALHLLIAKLASDPTAQRQAEEVLTSLGVPNDPRPLVLITGHRRENHGQCLVTICKAIATLAEQFPNHVFIYPVHPNPRVRDTVFAELGQNLQNVFLIPPLDYQSFVVLMVRSVLILTDSGGIQEEASSLGKRVVVLRDITERHEGLATGLLRLAGTHTENIVKIATEALTGNWSVSGQGHDTYGNGKASTKILEKLLTFSVDNSIRTPSRYADACAMPPHD